MKPIIVSLTKMGPAGLLFLALAASVVLVLFFFLLGPALVFLFLFFGIIVLAAWLLARAFGGWSNLFRLLGLLLQLAKLLPRLPPALRLVADGLTEAADALRSAASAVRRVNSTLVTAAETVAALELPAFEPKMKEFKIPTGLHSSIDVNLVVGLDRAQGIEPLAPLRMIVSTEAQVIDIAATRTTVAAGEIDQIAGAIRTVADLFKPLNP